MSTVLKGEALIDGFALGFSLHDSDGRGWHIAVSGPGGIANEVQTVDKSPWETLVEMLDNGIEQTCRKFPSRRKATR